MWKCGQCSAENDDGRDKCYKCEAGKFEGLQITLPDRNDQYGDIYKNREYNRYQADSGGIVPLGGWLMFFLISLVLGLIVNFIYMAILLTSPLPALALISVADIGFSVFILTCLTKRKIKPLRICMYVSVAISVVGFFINPSGSTLISIIKGVLWAVYFNASERVKYTFPDANM